MKFALVESSLVEGESYGGGCDEGEGRGVVKGREMALGLDLIFFYQQHRPTAGASLNVAHRATSRLVYRNANRIMYLPQIEYMYVNTCVRIRVVRKMNYKAKNR